RGSACDARACFGGLREGGDRPARLSDRQPQRTSLTCKINGAVELARPPRSFRSELKWSGRPSGRPLRSFRSELKWSGRACSTAAVIPIRTEMERSTLRSTAAVFTRPFELVSGPAKARPLQQR